MAGKHRASEKNAPTEFLGMVNLTLVNQWARLTGRGNDVNVIFLDVDGVLNAPDWWEMFWWNLQRRMGLKPQGKGIMGIERKFVRRLNWLVRKSGASIVISSSWRNTFTSWYQWLQVFNAMGFPRVGSAVLGRTCPHEHGVIRGDEIALWIDHPELRESDTRKIGKGVVDAYVILDDDSDMTDGQKSEHFVQTNGRRGLTMTNCRKARKILAAR